MPAALRLLLMTLILAVTSTVSAGAVSPPRYPFKVGLELSYHMDWSNTTKTKSGTRTDDDRHDMKIWVERKNADGSFRVIFYDVIGDTQTRGNVKTEEPVMHNLSFADIFPDGKQSQCHPINLGAVPAYLFPPLPADAEAMVDGWSGSVQDFRFESKAHAAKDHFIFDAKVFSPFYRVLGDEHASHYEFDAASGFVAATDETITMRGKYSMDGRGGLKLLSSRMMTDDALKQFTTSADAYCSAMATYDDQVDAAAKAGPGAEKLLASAGAHLKSDIQQLTDPIFRASAQERLDHHTDVTKEVLAHIQFLAHRIGKPAFAFAANDLDGNVVKLADQRGKVVVLDFWYRGCGWCARTTPIVNALESDFADKPVRFLAMSVDTDPADARFVVKQLEIKSTTLQAKELSEKFGVTGYPTLIVIDQNGNIRRFEDGYRATLREDLGKVINDLLKTP